MTEALDLGANCVISGSIPRFFSGFSGLEIAREGGGTRVPDGPQGGLP